jgi:hypothetical protein
MRGYSLVTGLVLLSGLVMAASPERAQDIRDVLEAMHLPMLSGGVPTYYSTAHEVRAARIQKMAAGMTDFYRSKLGLPLEARVAVLDSADYAKLRVSARYPMAFARVAESLVIMPATLEGTRVEAEVKSRTSVLQLPPEIVTVLARNGIRPEELGDVLRDALVFHELGHLYSVVYGIATPRRWLSEFLASYWSEAYTAVAFPEFAQLGDAMSKAAPAAQTPAHTSLADFESGTLGDADYEWYEGQFYRRVAEVFAARGLDFLTQMKAAFPADKAATLDDAEIAARLEAITPGWRDWIAAFGKNGGPRKQP